MLDISKYKNLLSLARGKEDITVDVKHDTVIYNNYFYFKNAFDIVEARPFDCIYFFIFIELQGTSCLKVSAEIYKWVDVESNYFK